jgi:hypothetical protein
MVPDRLTRKVMVLVVSGMAIAEGERQVSRSGIEPVNSTGEELKKRPPGSPRKTQFTSRLRSWQLSDFPLFLWFICSPGALLT